MSNVPSSNIHNVVLIGHLRSGKTSLAEALLASSGAITQKGRVEDGTTICDFEPEELKRHMSLSLALANFEQDGHKINILDTPGFADFISEFELAAAVADLAVVVVSTTEGVEAQTEVLWRRAEELGLPRLIFVNKLDHGRADFESTLESLKATFGSGVAPLELPIGKGPDFCGVADLLADVATTYADGKVIHGEIPDDMAELEHRVHEDLVEGIVVGDDALMERYLNGEVPTVLELEATLSKGIAAGSVFPVLCGSALRDIAIDRLSCFICEIGTHRNAHVRAGEEDVDVPADPDGKPLARVFKTIVDPFVGQISLLEVLSGTIKIDEVLVNPRTHADQKLHVLQTMLGKSTTPITSVVAGDIVAVPKLNEVRTGDTLAPKQTPVVAPPIDISPAALSIAIHPKSVGDDDRLMTGLHRLQEEEDPALIVERDAETHQTVLSGTGETHLQVVAERLVRKYNVEIETEELKIAYRETVRNAADAEGRLKKQSGGHGQYAVVHLRVEPLERGEGFVFVDQIVGGAIPRQFIPAVEKGVRRAMKQGGIFGFPVVDVRVTCDDGKFHSVDSSEASFDQAGAIAFTNALGLASPTPLEPISCLTVNVPARFVGDVLGNINAKRARVMSSESNESGEQQIVALVPTSELVRYAVELRSISSGHGRFHLVHDHYDWMPSHLVEKLPRQKVLVG